MNSIFKCFSKKNKKGRFILSFIGTIIYSLGGMLTMGISQYSVYITSYFHHKNVQIDMQYGNLVMPIMNFSNSLFSPLAGILDKKFGIYISLIISSTILELVIFIFLNQTNVLLSLILIIIIGFGNGLGLAIPGKNLYFYYPEKGGVIGAFMTSSFILVSTIFSVIGEKIINPGKYTLSNTEKFYPLNISQNYLKFFKICLIIIPISLLCSLCLIKKYDPKIENELIEEEIVKKKIIKSTKKNDYYYKNIKAALFSKRLLRNIGIITFSSFVFIFSTNTFRVYGALISMSGTIMQYSRVFTGFSVIFFGPLWGYINDKYKFEIIIKILGINAIFQSILFSIFIQSNTIYLICIFFGSIIVAGFMSAIRLHLLKVYGIKYSLEVGGVIGIFVGIFNILTAVLSFVISKYYQTGEELQYAYRIVYIVGIFFCCIAFLLSFGEKDDKFRYPYEEENEDNIKPKEIELKTDISEANSSSKN